MEAKEQKTMFCKRCVLDSLEIETTPVSTPIHTCGLEDKQEPIKIDYDWGSYDNVSPLRQE